MTEHYYSSKPTTPSKPMEWSYILKGKKFNFVTDTGVFSKKEVDFGSRLLIESYTEPDLLGKVLDLGCGYGPIGISLASFLPSHQFILADINERALALAKKNAAINKIDNIETVKSNLFDNLRSSKFVSILSNPPIRAGKQIVHRLFEEAYEHLEINGHLWIVIQKKQGAPSAIDKLKVIYDEVEVVIKKKGYYIIRAKKV